MKNYYVGITSVIATNTVRLHLGNAKMTIILYVRSNQ
jgi:hypothetical protein